MFIKCEKCGSLLSGTEKFCNGCGTPLSVLNSESGASVSVPIFAKSDATTCESNLNGNDFVSKSINTEPAINLEANSSVESESDSLMKHDIAPTSNVNINNPFLETEIMDNRCAEVGQVNNVVNANSTNVTSNYSNTVNSANTDENSTLDSNTNISVHSESSDATSFKNVSSESSPLSSNLNEGANLNTTNSINGEICVSSNKSFSNKKNIKSIIFLLLLFVLVASSFAIGYYFATNNSDSEEKNNNIDNIDNDVKPVVNTSTTYVDFGGKKIIIPEEYDYDIDNTYLYLKSKEWIFRGQIVTNTYSNILKNKDSVKKNFESSGYKVTDVREVAYDNTKYLVYTVSNSNSKMLAVYSNFDSKKVWAMVLTNQTATGVDINWVKDLSKILTSATDKGIDKNLNDFELKDFDFDVDKVLKIK